MPINWQDQATRDRLLAAIIASYNSKINCREVARIYGPDATYDAIENFLRKPKKQAEQLRQEAASRPASEGSSPAKRAPRTPKGTARGGGITSGRINKTKGKCASKPSTPIKAERFASYDFDEENENDQDNSSVGGNTRAHVDGNGYTSAGHGNGNGNVLANGSSFGHASGYEANLDAGGMAFPGFGGVPVTDMGEWGIGGDEI